MSILFELPFIRIAHRGASGYEPENTLPAFERALRQGVDALDVDVWLSKDGHLMVSYDGAVDRTTNGTGKIADLTLAELRALDAGHHTPRFNGAFRDQGYRIPTLEEVWALDDGELLWAIDIKDYRPVCVAELLAAIRSHDLLDRCVVVSRCVPMLDIVRERMPEVPTSLGHSEVIAFYRTYFGIAHEAYTPPASAILVIPQHGAPEQGRTMYLPTEGAIAMAHDLGMRVFVATVNDQDAMGSLIRAGVDGIYTDYPDRLNTSLSREAIERA